jgi:hypothetical protein
MNLILIIWKIICKVVSGEVRLGLVWWRASVSNISKKLEALRVLLWD